MSLRKFFLLVLSLSGTMLLFGCGASTNLLTNPVEDMQTPIGEISGSVHGGQAPVTGAEIFLYAASTGGYGKASTSLIKRGDPGVSCVTRTNCYVTTDSNGNFALSGDYTCTPGTQVYMVAVGGNPGLPGTVNNTAIVQMAGLGQCPAAGNLATQVPYLVINEVTTVAFAYAMSGFGTDATHISADATGATALANAMANANNIVNIGIGQATPTANGNSNSTSPQAKLYTLANIVAQCVNTSSASSSGCTSLFSLAPNSANTVPTDESTALFNIAHNQASNVTAIYNLLSGTPVFAPWLGSAPTDWTMPVIYNGLVSQPGTNSSNQIVSGPFNIAFDANGNAWIGDRVNGVVEVGPQGAATTINKGFGMVKGVAVSPLNGDIWVSDYGNNVVDVMDTTGAILTKITTDLSGPILTAFGGNTSGQSFAYEANETTTSVVLFDPLAYSVDDFENANFPDVAKPGWISVDNNGNAWIPSTSTNYVGEVNTSEKGKSGNFTYGSSEVAGPLSSYSMAADAGGDLWFGSNANPGDLQEITSKGTLTDIGNGGGVNGAYKIAVDGNNTVWISNANANTVSAYNGGWVTGTTGNGFSTSAAGNTVVATPDPSGNLWTANADGSVTQLLGLAAPTAAPIYGGISSNSKTFAGNLGTKP